MMVSTDRDALVSEIHIAAEPERVFQALIDPAQVPQWWGQKDVYRCETYEADLRVGGEWRMAGVGGDGGPFEIRQVSRHRFAAALEVHMDRHVDGQRPDHC